VLRRVPNRQARQRDADQNGRLGVVGTCINYLNNNGF